MFDDMDEQEEARVSRRIVSSAVLWLTFTVHGRHYRREEPQEEEEEESVDQLVRSKSSIPVESRMSMRCTPLPNWRRDRVLLPKRPVQQRRSGVDRSRQ